jgi:hypothetical protein
LWFPCGCGVTAILLLPLLRGRGGRGGPLLVFALSFQVFEGFLFTSAAGLLGRFLKGRPAVDSTALIGFLLSPRRRGTPCRYCTKGQ